MLNCNLAPGHALFTTFCSLTTWAITTYKIFVFWKKTFPVQPIVLVLNFTGTLTSISLWSLTFFSVWAWYMEKLAITSKIDDIETRTVFVSYMSDWFLKIDFDKMKHVIYNVSENTYTVRLIETTFYKHNQELFLCLFKRDDFSAMQKFVSVS